MKYIKVKNNNGITIGILVIIILVLATVLAIVVQKAYEKEDINILKNTEQTLKKSDLANSEQVYMQSIQKALNEAKDSGKFYDEKIEEISESDFEAKFEAYCINRTLEIFFEDNKISEKAKEEYRQYFNGKFQELFSKLTGNSISGYISVFKAQMN